MKNLNLEFQPRMGLINIISLATGPLGKMAPLQQAWKAICLTDAENAQIIATDNGNGTATLQVPPGVPGFGRLQVQIEDSHAAALAQELEAYQGFRITDLEWVAEVKRQLKGE